MRITDQYRNDKYLILYGFHPSERWSYEVGKNLETYPPTGADVRYFRPHSIPKNYASFDIHKQLRRSKLGRKELTKFVNTNYNHQPFVIDLHDTTRYAHPHGDYYKWETMLIFSEKNNALYNVLDDFRKMTKSKYSIIVYPEYKRTPTSEYLVSEVLPTRLTESGDFATVPVNYGVNLIRDLVRHLRKNYNVDSK